MSSAPASVGTGEARGFSEFQLPEEVNNLVMRILWDLAKPCRRQLENATAAHKTAIDKATADLSTAEAEFRVQKQNAVDEFELAQRTAQDSLLSRTGGESSAFATLRDTIRTRCNRLNEAALLARAHLEKYGIEISSNNSSEKRKPGEKDVPPIDSEECNSQIESIEQQLKEITESRPLAYLPKNGWAIGAIIGLTLFVFGSGLLWFPIVFVSRWLWVQEIGDKYRRLLRESETLWPDLEGAERRAAESMRSKIRAAEEEARVAIAEADERRRVLVASAEQKILVSARATHAGLLADEKTRFTAEHLRIEREFSVIATDLHGRVNALWDASKYAATEWDSAIWETWAPDPSPEFAARIGKLEIRDDNLQTQFPQIDFGFILPAFVPFTEGRCLLFNSAGEAIRDAAQAMLSVMVRVLANTPPGKARFTFIDPVGLGQNVADFMHLGDHNKDLISGKAWSEPQHIEQQLTFLTEHMETVIQTCLRNEFATIRDYNRERHEVAQPFRFLVIYDFPVNFTEAAARRLVSIVKNGPRCGVYTFILRDTGKGLPHGFTLSDLEQAATIIAFRSQKDGFEWRDKDFDEFTLNLDVKPPAELTRRIVNTSGEVAIPAMKIDVPFEKILTASSLERDRWWSGSSSENLNVPLGPAGARSMQAFMLGGEQEAHALLVGRTGSGKTNLMHVIITAIALKYAPSEVQLFLVDFKGGVGFKRYAEHRLPHARVIAIESEREFGMSVLRGLDTELKQRSDIFRVAGVDSLAGYRAKMKSERPDTDSMPRILLVVDEFQEFFSENDDLSQQAKMIFERLARQGRSFGIHFLLATQSLAGSAQLPSGIMGQIKVRIALPCSEIDSRLILADDNKAARALSQPGEAIYNPMGGLVEGNNRFQVARFSDDDLPKYLRAVGELCRNGHVPIVFEGNELAHLSDCKRFSEALQVTDWPRTSKGVELLLGEPIAIMPPVAATLRRQSGRNLIILTREEGEGAGICIAACLSILTQQSLDKERIVIADFTTADSEWAGHGAEIAVSFPGNTTVISRQRDFPPLLANIADEVQRRGDGAAMSDSLFLLIQGMHRIKSLREDDEDENGVNSVELLKTILRDGPEVGVHVIAWADTWGNATRGLDRKTASEFGLRVAAVMDASDSMNFLDSLAASKISKPHRALFYDEDRPGQLVTFRPYAMPTIARLKEIGQQLKSRGLRTA
ncbi:MAG: DNA translocase FtsK [Opitutae bacterium]|nr:DNA translocase FtsK [Opitutae bacterium]